MSNSSGDANESAGTIGRAPARRPGDAFLSAGPTVESLRGRTVRGGVATMSSEAIKLAISIITVSILARMLSPTEYGLVAQVLAITVLLSNFKDLGLAAATVQRRDISHSQVSTLFWINTCLGIAFGTLVLVLSPAIAWFYGDARLTSITAALAITFLFSGLSVQHLALLRRQMMFTIQAKVDVIATVVSSVAAVLSAALGASYWAIVVLHVTQSAVYVVGLWMSCSWRPASPARATGLRSMLNFGISLASFNVLTTKVRALDRVLIGKFLGSEATGLYSTAANLLLIPLQRFNMTITNVAIPTLSRLQDHPGMYRLYYRRGMLLLTSITMPIVVCAASCAPEIVRIVLGSDWVDATPIFAALGISGFLVSFDAGTRWVYITTGHTPRQLRIAIATAPVMLAGMVIGLNWGAIGVALGIGAAATINRVPEILWCFRGAPVRIRDLFAGIWRPAMGCAAGAGAAIAIGMSVRGTVPSIIVLLLEVVGFAMTYVSAWVALPGGVVLAKELMRHRHDLPMFNRRSAPAIAEVGIIDEV